MYYIIEVANTHAGSIDYVNNLIEKVCLFAGRFRNEVSTFPLRFYFDTRSFIL